MQKILFYITFLFFATNSFAQMQFYMSKNVYRIPYANGTTVRVSHDQYTHDPLGRFDLVGEDNGSSCSSNYRIVAAADGVVRRVVDSHQIHGGDCNGDQCSDFNNYVWIEHANGEWTKYTHMKYHSSSVTAGLDTGQCVTAGQFLGYECDIGHASGPHLHFEVRRPYNPNNVQISVAGGFMEPEDAEHLIPVFCGTDGANFLLSGATVIAGACGGCNVLENYTYTNRIFIGFQAYAKIAGGYIDIGTGVTFSSYSSSTFKSNVSVTFKPGVTISSGAFLDAKIGHCGTTASNIPCN